MGLYDREYWRGDEPTFRLSGLMLVTQLVLINAVLYVADVLLSGRSHALSQFLMLKPENLVEPQYWWRFLTYGFVHDWNSAYHIAMNMFVLWMFGRDVEGIYGRAEFLRIYLVSIVLGGIVWAARNYAADTPAAALLGASGGVTTIFMLYVCHFPRRTILLFFVIPVPAWLVGVLYVASDLFGARSGAGDVAFDVHLLGAAFALLYWWQGLRLTWLSPQHWLGGRRLFRRRPKIRVHMPDDDSESDYDQLDRQADALLEKVAREGIESLTPKERRTLEAYSRRMKQKHR